MYVTDVGREGPFCLITKIMTDKELMPFFAWYSNLSERYLLEMWNSFYNDFFLSYRDSVCKTISTFPGVVEKDDPSWVNANDPTGMFLKVLKDMKNNWFHVMPETYDKKGWLDYFYKAYRYRSKPHWWNMDSLLSIKDPELLNSMKNG